MDAEMNFGVVIYISIALGIAALIGVFFCVARVYSRSASSNGYSPLSGNGLFDGMGLSVPREFLNDEEALRHLVEEYDFTLLPKEDQIAYLKGEEFTQTNPPNFQDQKGSSYKNVDFVCIHDKGLGAFEFEQDSEFLQPRFIVEDRTEITFNHNENIHSCATSVLNYSLPVRERTMNDIVYFETKIFEVDSSCIGEPHFAIGLVTRPYPSHFRLPGYNSFSISYESTGNLKINKPLPSPSQQHQGGNSLHNALILPPIQQSDVVGFGYIISTGTLFITHNGKKIMDIMKGCYVDMYPAIGCYQTNAKFQVNIGQGGFVWIEANVRKYGFIATNDPKKLSGNRGLAALPEYVNAASKDKVLDKGEELPPRYPEDELDFFGRSNLNPGSSSQLELQLLKNEKSEAFLADDEVKPIIAESSTKITNDSEEIMDLRERIYEHEQSIKPSTSQTLLENERTNDETEPLLSSSELPTYVNATNDDVSAAAESENSNAHVATSEPEVSEVSALITTETSAETNNETSLVEPEPVLEHAEESTGSSSTSKEASPGANGNGKGAKKKTNGHNKKKVKKKKRGKRK